MKKTVIALYIVVIAVMAIATIIEKYQGTSYVSENIYGAWWFAALWALLTACAVFYFIKRKMRRASTVALHLSFVVILAGALLTHLTARRGIIHLRQGDTTNHYLTSDLQEHELPFTISLKQFEVQYHEGTNAPADYISHITIDGQPTVISMNKIANFQGIRLYQSSYDEDMQGTILALNSDPWGIPFTYGGYALLFVSLVWILLDPKGTYRQLLRGERLEVRGKRLEVRGKRYVKARFICLLTILSPLTSNLSPLSSSPRVLPQETAERFGQLFVVHNDRVCPMQTLALDVTKKLYGKRHYQDYTPEQVLTGFIFYFDDWVQEPLKDDKHNDERQMLISMLHSGRLFKIFPYTEQGRTTWYSPTDVFPETMDKEHQRYMGEVFNLLNGELQAAHYDIANQYLEKMLKYQYTFGNRSLPADTQVKAERLYNNVPFATILFMVCLTLGFLSFLLTIFYQRRFIILLQQGCLLVCFLALTLCLALRWIVTGTIPMSNGYETMLTLAWLVMLLAMFMSRRFPLMLTFGFLLSGFFLLVSHISQMDPQMTHLMPVLNSPLLTLHVSVIMMAFALLSLTFICSLTALLMRQKADEMHLLSQLMLFPSLTFLGFGIFIGAIWANVSWGTYWSWDPKETWALITFMVYAAPAHRSFSSRVLPYHLYMTLAFLTLLMTYFGVNFFLGGMHSYA